MYKSLYRIYRPKKFEDAIGQEYIVDILKNQLIENRVGHAYLFTGVRGTGKTTFAKILAKAVNCLDQKNGEPCLECENCKGIEDGSILDVIEMDAASNTGVDNIRDIIDESNYLPTKAKFRVYIIDEVHMLSGGAFNALLKTLEEPPAHVKFILATTEPQKLPATILSRCQRFDFKKVQKEVLSKYLEKIAKESKIDISKEALDLISILGGGSVRDAISILESAKSFSKRIEEKDIRNIIGIPEERKVIKVILNILNGDDKKAVEGVKEILNDGKESKILLEEMINVMQTAFIKENDMIDKYQNDEKREILKIIEKSENDKYYILKKLLEIESNIRWSEKKNVILIASIIDLSNYYKNQKIQKENEIKPEEIINILNENSDNTNEAVRTINKKENNIIEKKEKTYIDEIKNMIPFNKMPIQKALQKMGEMQIFAFVSNSDTYILKNSAIFIKKKNIDLGSNLEKIAKDPYTKEIIEKVILQLINKKYNVEIKEW